MLLLLSVSLISFLTDADVMSPSPQRQRQRSPCDHADDVMRVAEEEISAAASDSETSGH